MRIRKGSFENGVLKVEYFILKTFREKCGWLV